MSDTPRLVAHDEDGDVQVWTTPLDDHLVVVLPETGPRQQHITTRAISLVIRALSDQGLLRAFQRQTYLCAGRKWHLLQNIPAVRLLVAEIMSVVSLQDSSKTFEDVYNEGNSDVASTREFLAKKRGIKDWEDVPKELAAVLTGEQSRTAIPEAAGVVRHPFVGVPDQPWLEDQSGIEPATDGEYKHLRTLFEGLELDMPSHVALYSYLLASFHAASLSCPRPILLVDSWFQGRGKSEVCAAISRLVDDSEHSVSARRDSERFDDSLVSVLRSARTISIDNVDGIREYNLPRIALGATGSLEVRHKYQAGSTCYQGVLTSMNLVLGAASFHRDLLTRFSRVELTGVPRALTPAPRVYAQKYRKEIISEILQALTDSTPGDEFQSRFQTFDNIGLAAYCTVFKEDADWMIQGFLESSRTGVWVYHPDVFESFVSQYRATIPHLNDTIIRGIVPQHIPPQAEGARALDKVLTRKEDVWTWIDCAKKENV